MFENMTTRFKKLKMPEESLLKKIERIKKTSESGITSGSPASPGASAALPDISEKLKKTQEDMTQKIEEIIKSKTEQINTSIEAIKEFDVKLNKLEGTVSSSKNTVGEFKERLDKIDESLLELLSLYEVVSSTVNPFVGDKGTPTIEKLEQMEKKLETLSQKPSEFPANIKEEYDIKFKALEGSLEELTTLFSNAPAPDQMNQEDIIKKVSMQVMEQIRPFLDQKLQELEAVQMAAAAMPVAHDALSPASRASVRAAAEKQQNYDENVKLQSIDNKAETSIILLNWIEFLLEKVGRNNLSEVLEYYIDIGWISGEVCEKMMAYANGIDYCVERPTWKLLPDDHTKSLMFIEQIKGKKLDKNMLSRLERDVEKVIRTNEVYAT
ncbi:MAG: FlaD/FlaE family flagellar protein [Candidatus Methanoperedens sp.]